MKQFINICGFAISMKIALINPPWYSPIAMKFQTQNLGLSYLTAFFRQRGHTVLAIDALYETSQFIVETVPVQFKYQNVYRIGISYKDIVKQIPSDTGLVGIAGPTTNHARIIYELCDEIKKTYPSMKILIGGPYPAALPEDIITLSADYAIIGEPEVPLDKYLKNIPLKDIPGLMYKDESGWHNNGPAELLLDLDTIPLPAREFFHCNEILDKQGVARIREETEIVIKKARGVTMITSRGCPYGCGFCSIHIMNTRKWRHRSPEHVIAEMLELQDKYNVEEVALLDDHLLGNRTRLIKIMDMMIEKKIKLKWQLPNGIRVDYLDRELLEKMKHSGCNSLVLGIQNGSQEMINIMGTKLDLKKVEQVVKDAHELGLEMAAFLIVGYPGETRELFMKSIRFCQDLGKKYGLKDWRVNIARAYPKTALDKLCRDKGYYVKKDVENLLYFPGDDSEANIQTPEFTPQEVIWRRDYAKRKLMAVENPIYWNTVYYLERLNIKNNIKKIMPEKLWNLQKKMIYTISKKIG